MTKLSYLKKYGLRGCIFLAQNKLRGRRHYVHNFVMSVPKDAPRDIAVITYGPCGTDKKRGEGRYTAFIPRGTVIDGDVLRLLAHKIESENADGAYCDEVGFYKPDFSPDTLDFCDYIRAFVIKTELVGSFNTPSDLLKRSGIKVAHLAHPLFADSDALVFNTVSYTAAKGGVSIIIPSKDNYEVLKRCIDSIRQKTAYSDYEIIVTDNGSSEQTAQKCKALADKYIYEKRDFNFSYMCNIGARAAQKRFLLFLNDDTEVIDGAWLDKMTCYAAKPHIGAVGAKLYYPNSKLIQHCGVINIQPGPAHAFLGEDDGNILYHGRNRGVWNCTAVTAACLMLEKNKFTGFDESFAVAYNDVELCFRLLDEGLYNVVLNDVTLYHYESLSRGDDRQDRAKLKRLALEREHLFDKHPKHAGRDDFYNVNLTPYRVDYKERSYYSYDKCAACTKISAPREGSFKYKLEYAFDGDMVGISGYAFKKGYTDVYVLLSSGDNIYRFKTVREMRTDADAIYGRAALLGGFCLLIDGSTLPKGEYEVGIMLTKPLGVGGVSAFTGKKVRC